MLFCRDWKFLRQSWLVLTQTTGTEGQNKHSASGAGILLGVWASPKNLWGPDLKKVLIMIPGFWKRECMVAVETWTYSWIQSKHGESSTVWSFKDKTNKFGCKIMSCHNNNIDIVTLNYDKIDMTSFHMASYCRTWISEISWNHDHLVSLSFPLTRTKLLYPGFTRVQLLLNIFWTARRAGKYSSWGIS